jgi:hypothetical protein
MDATAQSEAGWTKHVAELCDITLFPGTDSWYMGVSFPFSYLQLKIMLMKI